MNLAAKHNIEVSLRPTDTVVLTIVNIEERQVRNADGSTTNADVLIGQADNGTRYTVRRTFLRSCARSPQLRGCSLTCHLVCN